MLVLQAISGRGPGRSWQRSEPPRLRRQARVRHLRVGYFPAWMAAATEVDRHALRAAPAARDAAVKVALPDWPYDCLNTILFAEAAAAFEELTLSRQLDELRVQTPDAWPNTFRQSRFISAVDSSRPIACGVPSRSRCRACFRGGLAAGPLAARRDADHRQFYRPAIADAARGFCAGLRGAQRLGARSERPLPTFKPPRRVPHGVTLIGRLFDEGTIARVGTGARAHLDVVAERPPGF